MRHSIMRQGLAILMILSLSLTACGSQNASDAGSASSKVPESSAAASSTASESLISSSGIPESQAASETSQVSSASEETADAASDFTAPELPGLSWESTMELNYANQFAVQYYSDDYKLLQVSDGAEYLIVPEGKEAPEGLDSDIQVLYQPLDKIYLAATAVMSLFDAIDSVGNITLSGTQASGWYIDSAKKAMEDGKIGFAGKYNEPDYEMLVQNDCDLAIESTMILHTPKVREMIMDLDIPVIVDYSSYETHPLGRVEWIKFYGALMNKEDEAAAYFAEQTKVLTALEGFENTGKTVAFFYINTDGTAVVREPSDYIATMINVAGGKYIFTEQIQKDSKATSVSMDIEKFYEAAKDADYLIYNGTIDTPLKTVDDLLEKNELFADFKAVQEGNVWCCGGYLYQATATIGNMITDINGMLTGKSDEDMTFLQKVD